LPSSSDDFSELKNKYPRRMNAVFNANSNYMPTKSVSLCLFNNQRALRRMYLVIRRNALRCAEGGKAPGTPGLPLAGILTPYALRELEGLRGIAAAMRE
jgi:hypothetical protein